MSALWIRDEMEIVTCDEDFEKVLREKLGDDFAKYFSETVKRASYTDKKVNSDLDSYEASLEDNQRVFQDVLEAVDELKAHLDGKRLSRSVIGSLLQRIERDIKEVY